MKSNNARMLLAIGGILLCVITVYSFKGFFGSNEKVANVPKAIAPKVDIRSLSNKSIFEAVEEKDVETIKAIIASDKSKLNDVDAHGKTVMHIIAKRGHYQYPPMDIPKTLIDGGININALDKEGQTPLVISLLSGWQKIAMLLLDSGADRTCVTEAVKNRITCPDCKRVVTKYNL